MNITFDKLARVCAAPKSAAALVAPLQQYLSASGIDNQKRIAAFIAQGAHESMHFSRMREIWGPTPDQVRYERDFSHPWAKNDPVNHKAFGLGNTQAGDGHKFLGRAIFETTGRFNYTQLSMALYGDLRLLEHPELIEQPDGAVRATVDFWNRHNLSAIADAGNLLLMTKVINGGENGWPQRQALYKDALSVDWMA